MALAGMDTGELQAFARPRGNLASMSNLGAIPIRRANPLTSEGHFELYDKEVVAYIPRHPGLQLSPNAYGFYIYDDSMYPAWRVGAHVIVDPARPPIVDHDVVIRLRGTNEYPRPHYLLRRYMGREDDVITLRRLNPFDEFKVKESDIESMHYVLELYEVLRP